MKLTTSGHPGLIHPVSYWRLSPTTKHTKHGLLWFINPVLTWDNSNTRIVYGMCFSLHCEHGRGTTLWYNASGLPRRDGFWGGQCVRMTSSFTKNPQVWMVLEVFSIHLFLQDWKRRIWCDMQRYALETLQTWLSLRLTCLTLLRFQPHRADRVPFFGHGATVPKGADVLFKKELAAQPGQPGWDGSPAVRSTVRLAVPRKSSSESLPCTLCRSSLDIPQPLQGQICQTFSKDKSYQIILLLIITGIMNTVLMNVRPCIWHEVYWNVHMTCVFDISPAPGRRVKELCEERQAADIFLTFAILFWDIMLVYSWQWLSREGHLCLLAGLKLLSLSPFGAAKTAGDVKLWFWCFKMGNIPLPNLRQFINFGKSVINHGFVSSTLHDVVWFAPSRCRFWAALCSLKPSLLKEGSRLPPVAEDKFAETVIIPRTWYATETKWNKQIAMDFSEGYSQEVAPLVLRLS